MRRRPARVRRIATGGPLPSPALSSRPPGSRTVRSPTFTMRARRPSIIPPPCAIAGSGFRDLASVGDRIGLAVVLALVGQTLDRDHVFVHARPEDDHAG